MGVIKADDSSFILKSYECCVTTDVSVSSNRRPIIMDSIKVSIDETKPIKFEYESGEGLINLSKRKANRKANLLGSLLKIKDNDFQAYVDYLTDNGFFFPIEPDRIQKASFEFLNKYKNRLTALTQLINEVGNLDNLNYRKIMELSLYLFFDEGWSLNTSNAKYKSYEYELAKLIDDPFSINEKVNKQEEINKKAFTIEDSIFGTYELLSKEYHNIIDGYSDEDGWDDYRFKGLVYLYANKSGIDDIESEIVDLLFHFFYQVGIPQDITIDGVHYYEKYNDKGFDEYNMIDSVISFANYIIGHEINSGIEGIKPICDIENMKSKWIIPSLSNALYFSLFYLDKNKTMYRRCEHCGSYFIVNRSSSTRRYCDKYCRNNAQQAKHRVKNKQK